MPSSPRATALARLLEDWEAGMMTAPGQIPRRQEINLSRGGLVAHNFFSGNPALHGFMTLCPTGLAAARAARDAGEGRE